MQRAEAIRLALFICAVGGVFSAAAIVLLRQLVYKTPVSRSSQAALGLAGLGVLCFLYGWKMEPYWPELTRTRIRSAKLAKASRPIRIVQLSDLHSDPVARLEERLPKLVAALSPDLILFTGDTVNSPEGLPVFRRCFKDLAAIAPTYGVLGNWDVRIWPGLKPFEGTGLRELRGEGIPLEIAGAKLWLSGVTVDEEPSIRQALAAPPKSFSIFLHHYPDFIGEASQRRADLYLAGHTHGGQVALPFYGALVTLSRFGKRFEAGLYRVKDTWLYVNRGIGMEGGNAPRVRFCARPEIALIELLP